MSEKEINIIQTILDNTESGYYKWEVSVNKPGHNVIVGTNKDGYKFYISMKKSIVYISIDDEINGNVCSISLFDDTPITVESFGNKFVDYIGLEFIPEEAANPMDVFLKEQGKKTMRRNKLNQLIDKIDEDKVTPRPVLKPERLIDDKGKKGFFSKLFG